MAHLAQCSAARSCRARQRSSASSRTTATTSCRRASTIRCPAGESDASSRVGSSRRRVPRRAVNAATDSGAASAASSSGSGWRGTAQISSASRSCGASARSRSSSAGSAVSSMIFPHLPYGISYECMAGEVLRQDSTLLQPVVGALGLGLRSSNSQTYVYCTESGTRVRSSASMRYIPPFARGRQDIPHIAGTRSRREEWTARMMASSWKGAPTHRAV